MGAFSAEIGQCRPPGEPGVKTFRGTPWKRWLTNNKLKQSWRLIHVTWPQNPQNKHGIKCVGLSHREGRSHSAQTADSTVRGLPGACPWGGQRENQAEPGRRSRGASTSLPGCGSRLGEGPCPGAASPVCGSRCPGVSYSHVATRGDPRGGPASTDCLDLGAGPARGGGSAAQCSGEGPTSVSITNTVGSK